MKSLNSEQKAHLRSLGRGLRPDVHVGKGGLEAGVIKHVSGFLERNELVKLRLLEAAADDRRAAAEELAKACKAELIDLIGRNVVLYRPNPQLPPQKRIELP